MRGDNRNILSNNMMNTHPLGIAKWAWECWSATWKEHQQQTINLNRLYKKSQKKRLLIIQQLQHRVSDDTLTMINTRLEQIIYALLSKNITNNEKKAGRIGTFIPSIPGVAFTYINNMNQMDEVGWVAIENSVELTEGLVNSEDAEGGAGVSDENEQTDEGLVNSEDAEGGAGVSDENEQTSNAVVPNFQFWSDGFEAHTVSNLRAVMPMPNEVIPIFQSWSDGYEANTIVSVTNI